MIDHIFVLTTYYYSAYSYSGIEEYESTYFLSYGGAQLKAIRHGLKIVDYVKDPEKECTITQETIYP